MKKRIFIALAVFFTVAAQAQTTGNNKTKQKSNATTTVLKDHVCTAACTNENHVYAHGEKGHTCTSACKATETSTQPAALKEHVCTAACEKGKHAYAHGEKGHVCTDACKKPGM